MLYRFRHSNRKKWLRYYEEGGTVEPEKSADDAPAPSDDKVPTKDSPDKVESEEKVEAVDVDEPEESTVNKILNKLFGYMPNSVSRWLKANGDKPISDLVIKRAPVTSAVTRIIDLASLGGLSKAQKKLSYDRLWHLYLEFNVEGKGRHMTEKNETIKLVPAKSDAKHTESYPLKNKDGLTMNDLLMNAIKRYGEKKVTVYDAFSTNCQNYIAMLLSSNGLLTKGARSFIMQDTQNIAKELPNFIPKKAKQVTDVAATINKILEVLSGGRIHLEEGGLVP